jgi:2-polyprenyl-3-methyl-5-hydroxy-6-metoxy-1,4-benzoquinol methylase
MLNINISNFEIYEVQMDEKYDLERSYFNRVASKSIVKPMDKFNLDRYASPRWPHLFPKEKMFALAGDLKGKSVLEIGCGEGREAVQLAYCGANVTAVDISDISIDVARQRAELEGFQINFKVDNIVENNNLGEDCYDIVWCNLILHHLVESLETVMSKLYRALKPGGIFVSREPVAYANWLKVIRNNLPIGQDEEDPNEQPFRESEILILKKFFPDLCLRYYRILARADQMTNNLNIIRTFARVDNFLFILPGSSSLAGDVVMWAKK